MLEVKAGETVTTALVFDVTALVGTRTLVD
jgi:hypothetical protein